MRDGSEVLLGDVVEVNPKDPPLSASAPFVPMDAVEPGARWPTYYDERGSRGGARFRSRDVLMSRITPCLENGKVAQVPRELVAGGGSTEFVVLRAGPRVDPDFLYVWASWQATIDHATALMVGTSGRKRVSAQDIAKIPFLLPPLVVQRRVVDLVEAVDAYAARASQVATASSQLFFAATASIDRLSGECVELGEIAEVVSGVTKDSKRQQDPSYVEVPYLRVANVQRAALDLSEVVTIRVPPAKVLALRLELRDVLFNEGGDRDKLGRGWVWEGQIDDCIHQNHVLRARIHDGRFDPYFVAGWANGPFGQRWFELNGTQTTNLASLNLSTLRRFPVPVVDARVQVDIGEALLQLKAVLGASAAAETAVRRLRGRLLDSLLSGGREIPDSYDEMVGLVA